MSRRALALAGMALLIGACGGGRPAGGSDLDGAWQLERGSHAGRTVPLVEGSPITLTVQGSQIGGRSACNLYGGTIERDGQNVRISALTTTEMACDAAVMASEAAYVAALADVERAAREGDRLTLSGPGVGLELVLLPPVPTAELVGTSWTLDSLIAGETVSSVAGKVAALLFRDDGTLAGSTGCRSFHGTYVTSGAEIQVTELTAEARPCPDDLAAQDAHVLAVIGDELTAAVEGNRLTLSRGAAGLGYLAAGSG